MVNRRLRVIGFVDHTDIKLVQLRSLPMFIEGNGEATKSP
jgi:Fe2+ transport system protein FeoA